MTDGTSRARSSIAWSVDSLFIAMRNGVPMQSAMDGTSAVAFRQQMPRPDPGPNCPSARSEDALRQVVAGRLGQSADRWLAGLPKRYGEWGRQFLAIRA